MEKTAKAAIFGFEVKACTKNDVLKEKRVRVFKSIHRDAILKPCHLKRSDLYDAVSDKAFHQKFQRGQRPGCPHSLRQSGKRGRHGLQPSSLSRQADGGYFVRFHRNSSRRIEQPV